MIRNRLQTVLITLTAGGAIFKGPCGKGMFACFSILAMALLPAFGMAETWERTNAGTYSFTVPPGVTTITVEAWGGGGRGGRRVGNNSGTGGGGGGGAYARSELEVTPGETYEVVVGQGSNNNEEGGDTSFGDPELVRADGGGSVGNNQQAGAAGGAVADSLGDTRRAGGDGADGGDFSGFFYGDGGGGGSSAGPDAAGNDATDFNGATAPAGGGDGGDGGEGEFFFFADSQPGEPGETPGGGGGGATRVPGGGPPIQGGSGADGQVRITFQSVMVVYRMEEAEWTGAAGEVFDETGQGRDATPRGGVDTAQADPALPGDPGTCRYGDFDGNDDELRDADAGNYLNGLDAITVMAWVYNSAGLSGNDRGIFFTANNGSGQDNRLGLRYDADGFFGGGSNVIKASIFTDECDPNAECLQVETVSDQMVQGQWHHLAMTWQRGGSIRVFVDGAEVGISDTEGTGGDGLIDRVERLDVGQGAKGQRWQGRIDEFRIFGSALSESEIVEQKDLTFPCDVLGPDHIRLEHPGQGLTCSPSDITVRACADQTCSTEFQDPVDVEMTSPSGNWSTNPVTVDGGQETVTLQYTTAETVALDAEATDPPAQNNTRCFVGNTETCEMTFFESGFLINVPDHIADNDVTGTIAAVRESDTSEQCVPGFENETKDVELWSDYINPSSGTQSVAVDGADIPTSQTGSTRSLSFDGNGEVEVTVRYPDVGRMELNAFYEQTDSSEQDFGLTMQGAGQFATRPDRFELTVPGNEAATSVEPDNDFTVAGADFEVEVAALNANGDITPNFGQESPAESVEVTSSLFAPGGGSPGALSGSFGAFGEDCDGNSAAGGTACGRFQWSEVGIISLMPSLAGGAYLGTGDVEGDELPHVGRFIPDRFETSIVDPGSVEPFCDVSGTAFAYSGQALGWQDRPRFTVTALNVDGNATENYTIGNFRRLEGDDIDRIAPLADSTALDRNGNPYPVNVQQNTLDLVSATSGIITYDYASSDELTYQKSADTLVDPFIPNLEFVLNAAQDADGVDSPDLPLDFSPQSNFELRFGRLRLDNTFGPETRDLIVPAQVEYWDSGRFVLNVDEGCWSYDAGTDATLDQSGLSGGSTSISGTGTMMGGQPPSGDEVVLTAPGEGNTGQVGVTFGVPIWLRDDFNGDGALEDPTATATFGVFRGHDRIIYWREVQ